MIVAVLGIVSFCALATMGWHYKWYHKDGFWAGWLIGFAACWALQGVFGLFGW